MDQNSIIVAGGVTLVHQLPRIIRWLFQIQKVQLNDAKLIRDEMRAENESINERLDKVNADVDLWRERYYSMLDKYISIKNECARMRAEIDTLKGVTSDRTSDESLPSH